jgi:hypothetical protein
MAIRINIAPKEGTPYFAMPSKVASRREEFLSFANSHKIGINWYATSIVEFETEEDFTFFLMAWPHGYELVG